MGAPDSAPFFHCLALRAHKASKPSAKGALPLRMTSVRTAFASPRDAAPSPVSNLIAADKQGSVKYTPPRLALPLRPRKQTRPGVVLRRLARNPLPSLQAGSRMGSGSRAIPSGSQASPDTESAEICQRRSGSALKRIRGLFRVAPCFGAPAPKPESTACDATAPCASPIPCVPFNLALFQKTGNLLLCLKSRWSCLRQSRSHIGVARPLLRVMRMKRT